MFYVIRVIKIIEGSCGRSEVVLGCTYLCSFQYIVLDHQHVLVGQTDVILSPLSDSEHLIADWLSFTGPSSTQLCFLLHLTTQEVSRQLHHSLNAINGTMTSE